MADTTTLQSFLVELGFSAEGQQQFLTKLQQSKSAALSLGSTMSKVGVAIAAAGIAGAKGTLAYAKSLEQLNFVAQRTGTSLRNLRALQLTGASLGSSAAGAQASLEGLASFMRSNPGSSAFLQSLGVQTRDAKGHALDTVQVMEGLAAKFKAMPVYMAEQYASMLGISEHMMLAMRSGQFNALIGKYSKAEGPGVGKAGSSAHELMQQDRLLEAHEFGMAAQAMTPAMDALTKALQSLNDSVKDNNGLLAWLLKVYSADQALGQPAEKLGAAAFAWWTAKQLLKRAPGAAAPAAEAAGAGAAEEAGGGLLASLGPVGVGLGLMLYPHSTGSNDGARAIKARWARTLFPQLEAQDKLPKGLLDAVWAQESGRGAHLVSPAGAQGDFQFMPATAKALGLKNPFDFQSSAKTAAYMYAQLLHAYGGDTSKALAAYNWGSGNLNADLRKHGADWLRYAPAETQNYVRSIEARMAGVSPTSAQRFSAGTVQNIHTTIHVSGAGNPNEVAQRVAHAQKAVHQQAARNTAGAYR